MSDLTRHNWADNRSGLSNRTGEQGKHGRGQPEDYRTSAAARRCSADLRGVVSGKSGAEGRESKAAERDRCRVDVSLP